MLLVKESKVMIYKSLKSKHYWKNCSKLIKKNIITRIYDSLERVKYPVFSKFFYTRLPVDENMTNSNS